MHSPRIYVLLTVLLLGGCAASWWGQRDQGLADNGDFIRSVFTFTSGPVGLPPGWPPEGTAGWQRRFYHHWLPRWNLRWVRGRPITSAETLWLPGVLVATVTGQPLDLRVVSLFPKALLLAQIAGLAAWAWRRPPYRLALFGAVVVPVALLFTTTDYTLYLQTFYQESASLVFLGPLLASGVWFRRRPTGRRLWVLGICLALLTLAKRSNVYWPWLLLPFVLTFWLGARRTAPGGVGPRWAVVLGGVVCTALFSLAVLWATQFGGGGNNTFHSFFNGALVFSAHPDRALRRFGLEADADCVGQTAFSPAGKRFLAAHPRTLGFRQSLWVYLHEPGAVWRAASCGLGAMQDISLETLGKYAPGDARAAPLDERAGDARVWDARFETSPWNLWSWGKFHVFPTGLALALCLLAFGGWFAWRWRARVAAVRELATVGALAALACPLDLGVALLGEGRADLIKHLFLANLLFDVALVAFLGSVAVGLTNAALAKRRFRAEHGGDVSCPSDPA